MMRKIFITFLLLLNGFLACAQQLPEFNRLEQDLTPIKIAEYVADKIVESTEFEFEYVLQSPYRDIEAINFSSSLDNSKPSVAYAYSILVSELGQTEEFEIGSTGGVKIWINNQLVFHSKGDYNLPIVFEEKTYKLQEKFAAKLNEGENTILIKSDYSGKGKWEFLLQSRNMGVYAEKGYRITPTIQSIAPKVHNLSKWLILGCFENQNGNGLNEIFEPERSIEFHEIYSSQGRHFAWDIPRLHINTSNPDGGKFYRYSYHVGGFVWGLQRLSQVTGNLKYAKYAEEWCTYTLGTIPIAEYQTKELHAVRSMNWSIVGRPMLDYTTAPSLPFITRLVYESDFDFREKYVEYAEMILDYVQYEQFRLSNGLLARQYTTTPTVWVDDMFMGMPYMLFGAKYTDDIKRCRSLYDDVANQVIRFNELLYKKESKLYVQACYVDRPDVIIPFWSRGNGWAVWATSEVLLHLPQSHSQYKAILKLFCDHVDGIAKTQDDDGYWHNLLNDHSTVRESSGAAMFILAIARGINNGWLKDSVYGHTLEKGWNALKTFIDEDGNLHGVKGGTNFSSDPADYERTPFRVSDTHGILPLLFACIEMENYYLKM